MVVEDDDMESPGTRATQEQSETDSAARPPPSNLTPTGWRKVYATASKRQCFGALLKTIDDFQKSDWLSLEEKGELKELILNSNERTLSVLAAALAS